MKTLSIKTYLTRLIWLCMGPLVLLAAYLSISNVLDRQAERDLEAANLAKSFATMIDQHLNARISALHMLAESSLVDDPSRWKDLYREAQGFHQGFGSHVIFADLNMRMLFNTRVPFGAELPLLPRPKGHSAVSAVLETGRPAIGDSFFGPIAKEPLVAIAVPARREGKVAFILLTIFETRQFQALLDQVALPESWALTLLDSKQEGLARRAASGSNAATDVDAAGRFEVKLIASPWSVLLEIPRNAYRKPLIQSAFILIEVLLGVTLVSLLGGHWFGRRLARVVASLAEGSPPVAVKPAIAEIEAAGAMLHEAAAAKALSEKDVRKSEERFRVAQEMSPDGFTILRPLRGENGEIVDFAWVYENQTIARMNGTDPQAVIGKRLLDLFPTHQGTSVFEAYVRAANTGTRQIIEEICVGEIVSTPAWLRLVVVSMGEDIAVLAQDITERKQLEIERQKFFLLAESSSEFIGMCDLDMNPLYVNPAGRRMVGLPDMAAACRVKVQDYYFPEDQRFIAEEFFPRVLREGHGDVEIRLRHFQTGEPIWMFYYLFSVHDASGTPVGWATVSRDITERRQAEAALRESEEEFRRLSQEFHGLLDAIPDSLTLVDADLKVLWANQAAVETVGMTMEAVAGRHCFELWHNRSSACDPCPVERTFTTGQPQSETVTGPGGSIWDIRTAPIVDAQGRATHVIEVKRDITEHRKLEDQLRQAQKLEGIGQLAGGIAHDFNNVLGAVMGFAGVLQMKMSEGDPLRHYTDELVAAGERGANLTRQILAFSRKQVFDLKPVRLNGIVRGLEKMLRRLLPESIDISQNLHKEDPVVLVDTGQIEQVLINLATNARDAIAGIGGIGIATGRFAMDRDFVEAHGYGEPGEYAVLAVSDTGRGMDAATRARIFEPFFTTKEPGKGTGLGLAVVYGIVKQHRGFINVYSEVGKGTVIRVYLPLAAGAVSVITTAAPPARIAGGSETILIAEDDEILRKLSRTLLGQHGYTVIEAEDGEDAVAKFATNQDTIRLVILDGLMPKMGGVEALEKIRRLCPGIKAVFMSGYADDIFTGGGLRDKGAAFIQKPVMPTDLLRKVREVLDG